MNILVTGGCGFIGSHFIRYMLAKYPTLSIINLDKLTYAGNLENLTEIEQHSNYQFIKGDICDKALVEHLVSKVDAIIHFAAETHVDRSISDASTFLQTNVLGTHVLLEAARKKHIRFHHISTDEVFGALGPEGFFSEKTPYAPRSPYAASKAAADHLVRAYFETYHLPITITNCSNNYGPNQYPEKIIPLFITNILCGKKVPLYGAGNNVRDWLYVLDHCEAIDLVLHKGKIGETYCIGGECELTNIELTRTILRALNKGEEIIEHVPDRLGHDYRYAMDISKIKRDLGWTPKTSFEMGIQQTINWYQTHKPWWSKLLP